MRGIIKLIQDCAPKTVLLTQRDKENFDSMQELISKIEKQTNTNCYFLQSGATCMKETKLNIPKDEAVNSLKNGEVKCSARGPRPTPIKRINICTIHVAEENRIILTNFFDAYKDKYAITQNFRFCAKYGFDNSDTRTKTEHKLFKIFKRKLKDWKVIMNDDDMTIIVESVKIEIVEDEKDPMQRNILVSWNIADEDIALYVLEVLYSFG